MDYTNNRIINENEINDTLPTPGFQLVWLPFSPGSHEKRVIVLDVDLYNLKRAYNVSLESQESITYPVIGDCVRSEYEEGDEDDWIGGHHPLEFCESEIIEEEENDNLLQDSGQEYKCYYCYFEGTILQLQKHTTFHHLGELIKTNWCEQCKLNFENDAVFKQHQTQEHAFYCLQCNKTFKRRRLLLAHLPIHSEDKCFKCPTCEKVFPAYQYFVRHLERHAKKIEVKEKLEQERVFRCTMCQKGFSKKESLVKHTRIHSRESLKCSLCGFTCGKKVTLKMHVILHEGNRKYKCSHCDFSFKQIGHLKRHIVRFNH